MQTSLQMPVQMQCVILESPSSGNEHPIIYEKYAKACVLDSLLRRESPFSAFLLYRQPDMLEQVKSDEIILGKLAEIEWSKFCTKMIVYKDLGVSKDMQRNIDTAIASDCIVEYRTLNDSQFKKENIAATIASVGTNSGERTSSSVRGIGGIGTKKFSIPDFLKY